MSSHSASLAKQKDRECPARQTVLAEIMDHYSNAILAIVMVLALCAKADTQLTSRFPAVSLSIVQFLE